MLLAKYLKELGSSKHISLQIKYDVKPYQALPRWVTYVLNIKRNPHVKCRSHYLCHSIVKLLYIVKEKKEKEKLECTSLCTTTIHIELYVCMFLLLVTLFVSMNCKCLFEL